jgi:hypothetical protein
MFCRIFVAVCAALTLYCATAILPFSVDNERRADHAAVVFGNVYICHQQQLHLPAAIQRLEGNEPAIDRQREGCLKLW